MKITRSGIILTCLLLGAGNLAVVAGQTTKYGVTVQVSKAAGLANAKTYSWAPAQPSPDKTIDGQIVAAVDRELKGLGFTKAASGKGDVLAMYASVRRTDVDLKAKGGKKEYPVGTLLVELREAATSQPLFRVRIDKPLDADPDKLEAAINDAVAAMFQKYPTRTAAKR